MMVDKKRKVPNLRFKGFTNDWVQRKLGDVVENQYNGQTPSRNNPDFWGGEIPWLTSGELNHGIVNNTVETITVAGQKDANLKIVPAGTFVMAITGLEAPGTRGNSSILGFDTTVNQSVMALFPNEKLDTKFLFQWYQKVGEEYGISYTQGTKQQSYNAELIKILPFTLPDNVEEQQRIAKLLFKLDDLIAANQRKLDLLKEQKKGYLQKMFPKNGAKVPELRFAGFADAWEQRKLGDLIKEFSIKSKIEDEYKVLSSTNSGMKFREGRVTGTSNLGYKIIKNGDLVLSPQNLWLGNININNIGKGLVSPSYKTFKLINIDSSFINPQLRTQKMLEEYKNSSTQGASVVRRNLEIDSFYQIKIFVPTISEQEKIGSFFQQLDNTIVLQHQKLTKYQSVKKSLLQQMFI